MGPANRTPAIRNWTPMETRAMEIENMKNQRVIVCAANRNKAGLIVAGARHWDSVMRGVVLKDGARPSEWFEAEQGFIDQAGVFLTREEAWKVAESAGQIKYAPDHSKGILYSEDLY